MFGLAVLPITTTSLVGFAIAISIVAPFGALSSTSSATYKQYEVVGLIVSVVPENEETPSAPENPLVSTEPNCASLPSYDSLAQSYGAIASSS